ncbi:MAG TPA: DUF5668 domain-containing protein [Thermoanaerobaculia bacterium]|jgi:hypothetical protein|nr:DUF5668 domain-containing protein [Thermoanaerobaculia bacterium]
MNRRIDANGLFWGLLLILVGTAFLADRYDLIDVHRYWPMFLIALGVSRILSNKQPWGGVWLVLVGLWCQAAVLHVLGMNFGSSWPLLLIALGATMVLRTFFEGIRVRHDQE